MNIEKFREKLVEMHDKDNSTHNLEWFINDIVELVEENLNEDQCRFTTGICGSLTCCKDGLFDHLGYPINECKCFPCDKYLKLSK